MPRSLIATFFLACPVLFISCARSPLRARSAEAVEVPTVAVAEAKTQDLSRQIVLTAEFKPFQEIEVMAKVAGYVSKINVDAGDRVALGELLATLEVPEMSDDLRRADAASERASADVARAQDELNRDESAHQIAHLAYQRLYQVSLKRPGLVAQQEIDNAHGKDLVAEAQVSAAKSALEAAKEQGQVNAAEVEKIKTLMGYTRVTAPFAGVITKRYADTGSMIQAGTASQTQAMPLVRLAQNSLLRLILPAPESVVPTVHIGQQVEVRVPTLNRSFPGTVARFADQLSLATRTMDTEVDVPNPNLVLIPGMFAEVSLTLSRHDSALAIPVMAVDRDSAGDSPHSQATGRVDVVTPEGRVERRRVTLGLETASDVEIRSGLKEGDMVVLSGRDALRPGEEVRPKPTALMASASD